MVDYITRCASTGYCVVRSPFGFMVWSHHSSPGHSGCALSRVSSGTGNAAPGGDIALSRAACIQSGGYFSQPSNQRVTRY
mmetsp:Transcript_29067/g.52237  ORF Transcript_29067/g.52237 Transcript_29067/m.52237 type:complete len:80 (-) Transcript_29067:169-408(-)